MALPMYYDSPKSLKELRDIVVELINLGWCKGHYALDEWDKPVNCDSFLACKICLDGAIFRAGLSSTLLRANSFVYDLFSILYTKLSGDISKNVTVEFNDDPKTTKEDVVNLVKSIDTGE